MVYLNSPLNHWTFTGSCYEHGEGVGAPNVAEAFQWYSRAAALDCPNGLFNCGVCCVNGVHTPRDQAAARGYFERAAALQHPQAIEILLKLHTFF